MKLLTTARGRVHLCCQRAGGESLPWSSASENDAENNAEGDSDPVGPAAQPWAASAAGGTWGRSWPRERPRTGGGGGGCGGVSGGGGGIDMELQGMWGREMSPVLADLTAWPAPAPEPNLGQRCEH